MHTAKEKTLKKILFKKKKTLVSIRTRSRLNHYYETQTVRSVIIFRFYAISATNWNCLLLMVNSHEKKAIWLWNYKATTYTQLLLLTSVENYYGSNYYSPAITKKERKKQIFLVHNVSNSTAFSNSFYKKNEKKN